MKPLLALICAVIVSGFLYFWITDEIRDQRILQQKREESRRKDKEFHERFLAQEKAKADGVHENWVARLLREHPTWTREDAERRILAEKADARQEFDGIQQKEDVSRGCGILYETTRSKQLGDLTVSEARQIQACETLGLFH